MEKRWRNKGATTLAIIDVAKKAILDAHYMGRYISNPKTIRNVQVTLKRGTSSTVPQTVSSGC